MTNATVDEMTRCHDMMMSPAFRNVFIAKAVERREDLLCELIDTGSERARFGVKMLDEILGYEDDILEEIKSRNESAE